MQPLNLFRLNFSAYQAPDYKEKERAKIEGLNLSYLTKVDETSKAHIVVTNSNSDTLALSDSFLEKTQLLIHPNSGFDNLLKDPRVFDASFPTVLGNPIRAHAVSEYILGALFERFSSISHQPYWESSRRWNRELLKDQNVLILGFGFIGKILKPSLKPLVKKIDIYDPFQNLDGNLEELIAKADIVIPVTSLNSTSLHLFDQKLISLLKPGFTLINASRGKVIDQASLLKRLEKEPESFACLDVFEKEPFEGKLYHLPNLKTTSHIAGVFKGLDDVMLEYVYQVTKDFLKVDSFEENYRELILKNRRHQGIFI